MPIGGTAVQAGTLLSLKDIHSKGYDRACKITRGRVWLDRTGPAIVFSTVRMRASKKLAGSRIKTNQRK